MEWFKWYPEKYKRNTLHLTAEQDGIYRRLIDHYMETRRPLPNNMLALSRIAGVDELCLINAWSMLVAYFEQTPSNELAHKTCDLLLNEQDELAAFRTLRAKKAADARHKKTNENNNNPATSMPEALLKPARVRGKNKNKNKYIKPETIPENLWADFLEVVKVKKASITETSMKKIESESIKAKLTLEQVLTIMVEKSWATFEAEWLNKNKSAESKKLTSNDALAGL